MWYTYKQNLENPEQPLKCVYFCSLFINSNLHVITNQVRVVNAGRIGRIKWSDINIWQWLRVIRDQQFHVKSISVSRSEQWHKLSREWVSPATNYDLIMVVSLYSVYEMESRLLLLWCIATLYLGVFSQWQFNEHYIVVFVTFNTPFGCRY
jgi:hypothetical protein